MDGIIVSFETAKLLKKKGFDKFCNSTYVRQGENVNVVATACYNSTADYNWYSAPSLTMVLDWLLTDNDLFVSFYPDGKNVLYNIYKGGIKCANSDKAFKTPEEACESAINYCLTLIK